ncbi:putative Microspherule protein 1 [Cocos nucifera]|uniref:Putative Microspherule protein 1 n=1 Tax=Cocos nucifera TaxID=13894 RepID=A0A8K0IWD3_COCNU|nr:putative Microspherule protein 1 [Cocos nucifera]
MNIKTAAAMSDRVVYHNNESLEFTKAFFLVPYISQAGASLESLAKGAVHFSRRFTLRELQDRWYSLLYDPDISAEASARLIEFEIELSVSNPPKANRTCTSKGKDSLCVKRKGDSLRSHYYAMRKRVCHGPCSSANLGFLVPQCPHISTGNSYGCGDQLEPHGQHPVDDTALGAPFLNHYEHQETGYHNGQHDFSDMLRVDSAAAGGNITDHAFHTEHVNSVEDELPDQMVDRDCLYGYAQNISSMTIERAGENNANQSFGHDNMQKDHVQFLREDLDSLKACQDSQEIKKLQPLPASDLYDNEVTEANLDQYDGNKDGFAGKDNINSQVPECGDSLHQLGCSSPAPGLPVWGTVQTICAPTITVGMRFEEQEHDILTVNNSKNIDMPGCDGVTSEPKSNHGNSDAGLDNATVISENDFMDFSNMDLTDEGLLFIDVDEEDIANNACLNGLGSMLLNSPSNTHQDDALNSSDAKAAEVLDSCIMIPEGACPGGTNDNCDQICSGHDNDHGFCASEVNLPSSSLKKHRIIDPLEGFVICALNTEDPEIPCNDDVFLPTQVLPQVPMPTWEHTSKEQSGPISSSIKMLSSDGKHTVNDLTMVKEEQLGIAHPLLSSLKAKSSTSLRVGTMLSTDCCMLEAESVKTNSIAGVSRLAGIAVDDPNLCTSANVALPSAPVAALKEESTTQDSGKLGKSNSSIDSFIEKPVLASDHSKFYSLSIVDGCKEEADIQATQWNFVPSQAESVSAELGLLDPVVHISTSDQEEQISDSESEVPSFSDIEAMILDMDLGPYDQDSSLFTREVSRYHSVGGKKAILRLEQGARSFMNRAILSHGAFAVFYGRCMKYFIRTPEVSLGRATEDVKVDIDLGREGRANKISRRQAIIKMDDDGSFVLKNTGKCSIFVNSKEVSAKKRINLSSGSLIEIRDMRFIFEVNQKAVRQYITMRVSSQKQKNTRFEWTPGQNP